MLPLVNVGRKSLADYGTLVSRGLMEEIQRLAEPLAGARVVHISATAFGGGVAEINYTLVPLMADVGLDVEWRIMHGDGRVLQRHEGDPQRAPGRPALADRRRSARSSRATTRENAADFSEADYDFVIVHDPQPAAMIDAFPEPVGEVDLARAHRLLDAESRMRSTCCCRRCGATTRRSSTCASTPRRRTASPPSSIWPPAIDPLQPKNMALSPEDAAYIVDQFGIDVERPLLTQVSRFDPWKDPLGVIDAYRLVKRRFPEVQLALVGSMAHDDPEGWDYYNRTVEHAGGDPDIYILSNMNNVGGVEVNAFQVHSDAALQKSIEGGLRADRDRGALEGAADGRRARRRHRCPDRRRRDGLARRLDRGVRRGVHRDPARPGRGTRGARSRARSTCAGSS